MRKTTKKLLLASTTFAFVGFSSAAVTSFDDHSRRLRAREIIDENGLLSEYDYVIAGGGLAGLVLGARLSHNSTVLVIEAGLSGDAVADRINTPDGAYYSSIVGTEYDWKHVTVPQANLSDRTIAWPKGKILGGSTAMNAMYLVRPGQVEMDAWQRLITSDDSDAATRWGWNEMYAAMKRSENFTAPLDDVARVGNIQWDASTHGTGGPMSISYPGIMMSMVGNWTTALNAIGIPTLSSPNGGTTLGGFVTPSSINPTNWTRSYSRPAYISSLPPESSNNLHILPDSTVTRVRFQEQPTVDGWVANFVDFGRDANEMRKTVGVRREVILTAGSVGSAKILMHSGFGPSEILEDVGVQLFEDLPGVGQHLQDHLSAAVVWQAQVETTGDIQSSDSDFSQSPEFRSYVNDAVAYVNITTLFGSDGARGFKEQILSSLSSLASSLPPLPSPFSSTDSSTIIEGYKVAYDLLANQFYDNEPQVELVLGLMSPGVVQIQAAPQHPFSRGRLWINSTNPFDPVLIDPGYYSHFADIIMHRQGIKLVRQLGAALGNTLGMETTPGSGVQTDEEIEGWLRGGAANSQYHYACSCVMLPRVQGGCVDSKLRVYGAANVRVADSSVFPYIFAAHLASATYGLAEQAAVIIQQGSYTVTNGAIRRVVVGFDWGPMGLWLVVLVGFWLGLEVV
ncbi:hypothetical protein NP233_g1549 [Leucocoprinus birnbaumii]|uniref:pyranose dehydrogenase (acceptor) n=1 Tax=Leucocoprinus birnbaumii TaxID=56174 RepID=A0AAD5W2Z1_9AGAR|nr:hypothetical protein NP233_g1549 [Leucocoprinus birnbaumii]